MRDKDDSKARLTRWRRDTAELAAQYYGLTVDQHIWRDFVRAYNASPPTIDSASFMEWVVRNYSVAMTIGLRRVVGPSKKRDPISLHNLIVAIALKVDDVERASYVEHHLVTGHRTREQALDTHVAVFAGVERPTQESLKKEAEVLRSGIQPILSHGDQRVAHIDREWLGTLPTWGELDDALTIATATFQKYFRLFNGVEYAVDLRHQPAGLLEVIQRAVAAANRQ